jgi:hypothetical protein
MAEVGVIASLIGIIGAGAKSSLGLFDFAHSIGSSGSEIRAMGKEISLFCSVLRQLERTLAESKYRHSSGALRTTNNVLEECKSIFNEIDTIVSGLQRQRRSSSEVSVESLVVWHVSNGFLGRSQRCRCTGPLWSPAVSCCISC